MTTSTSALADIVAAASTGKQTVIVSPSLLDARLTVISLADMLAVLGADHTRHLTNGRERITFPSGGEVGIASLRSLDALRGRELDLVYLDDVSLDDTQRAAIGPALLYRHGVIVP